MWVSIGFALAREVIGAIRRVEKEKQGEAGSTKLTAAETIVEGVEQTIIASNDLSPTADLADARRNFIIAAVRYLNAIARTR